MLENISADCDGVKLVSSDSTGFPETLLNPPKLPSGKIDNLALAEVGRKLGLNAIVSGQVVNIAMTREQEGILWFRDLEDRLRIQFHIAVFDTETATKLFSRQFVHQRELEPQEAEAIKSGSPALFSILSESIGEITEDLADDICAAILNQPWAGYVVSVQPDRVTLSFGSDIGVRTGDKFEVHEMGEVIEGVDGHQFILPGKKIGEITITATESGFSEAEIVSGEGIRSGAVVRFGNS
mgnify:CR=1 FL=1